MICQEKNNKKIEKLELVDCVSTAERKDWINRASIYNLIVQVLLELGINHYTKPNGGIPKSDLSQDIVDLLDSLSSCATKEDIEVWIQQLQKVAFSGDYYDLKNIPNIEPQIDVDSALDVNSERPLLNKVIAELITQLRNLISTNKTNIDKVNADVTLLKNNNNKYVEKVQLNDVAFSGDYNDLSNRPEPIIIDSLLSTSSTNPIQNKAVATELNKKLSKLTSLTKLFSLNGDSVYYGQNVFILTGGGGSTPSSMGISGRGTILEALDYAENHLNQFYVWLVEQPVGSTTVRKIIWHIVDPNIYIDAYGAEVTIEL